MKVADLRDLAGALPYIELTGPRPPPRAATSPSTSPSSQSSIVGHLTGPEGYLLPGTPHPT